MIHDSIRTDKSQGIMSNYQGVLEGMSPEDLIKEFFTYLDYTEESESGREFHPVTIGCCRVALSSPLDTLLKEMRKRI